MNRKTISLALGALLLISFFLPYLSFAGLFRISGLDIITEGGMSDGMKDADKYLILLTPIAGILLVVGALNKDRYIPSRPILGVLGLAGVLYPIIRILMESKGDGMSEMFKMLGLGFWLGLAASIAVLAYNPKS